MLTELYLDGRGGEITAGVLRSLDLSNINALAMQGEGSWLASSVRHPGVDLSRLASHFATNWGRIHHWVARAWAAQVADSGEPQAPMGRDPRADVAEAPLPVKPPVSLSDEFLETVAANYSWALRTRTRPAPYIAEQTGYSVRTVHAWIRKARERGIIPPTTKGRVG